MDFRKIVPLIIKEFKKEKVEYALIGGFAMSALGVVRATADLDFIVDAKDLERIGKIMAKYGYRCVYKTENVSQYASGIKIFGEIDFLHALKPISLSMLKKAKEVPVLEEKHMVKVLKPEDIIGLKAQSAANNPARKDKEYSDINLIMDYYRGKLDWGVLEEYFGLFEMDKEFKALKKKYGEDK